jgi:transposase
VTFAVMPLFHLIERHVLAAERLHGDDSVLQEHTERKIEMV